jgi:phage terminase large subunit-like protein
MTEKLDYKILTSQLTDQQLKAAALLIKESQQRTKKEPLNKHKFNNYAQERFRALKSRYRNHKAANKVGKTDENGFELVAMCKGKCEEYGINFPHKPPLKIWYCGRDRNVLSDEPLASIKRYLKGEGIDHRTVNTGQMVNIMYIWDDDGNQSEIRFKPYNGEIGIFESANVHAVFMDEEPPRDIFSAIKTKIGVLPGYVFLTMTPDKGMSWTYDLISGLDPDHGNLFNKGMLETIESSVFENMLNFKIMTGKQWIKFPVEFIDKIEKPGYKYKEEDGETFLEAPDTFVEYIDQFTYGSDEYRMRILGHYVSFTGHVYPYDPLKNTFALEELPPLSELKFFGMFDYGYSDEACFVLVGIDKTNTLFLLDGFYQSYLDSRDQAKKIKEICDYWGVKPEMIVADNQIDNRLPQKDANKAHIQSIYDYYLDELGDNWTVWRREELDKRDPHIKRDAIVRALKDGKIKFNNHQNKMIMMIQELQRLEFKGGNKGEVKGKDHFDAAMRMFMGASISYDSWRTSEEVKAINKTHAKYRVKSRGAVY